MKEDQEGLPFYFYEHEQNGRNEKKNLLIQKFNIVEVERDMLALIPS